MRIVLQRVTRAEVRVEGETIGAVGHGLLALVGVERGDDESAATWCADKVAGLRIFADEQSRMNLDVREVSGDVLAVSQFTLAASTRKGRRPSFGAAEDPDRAQPVFDAFVERLRAEGLQVPTGRFGAAMEVELVNDGPVTLLVESPRAKSD